MNRLLTDILICPDCLPGESPLRCRMRETSDEDILVGLLQCTRCQSVFRIEDGIADLRPNALRTSPEPGKPMRYETPPLLAAYLWSHFADLWGDNEANNAYGEWASLFTASGGLGLDAGCAVGRFGFELAEKSDFVVGLDFSRAFIRAARDLAQNRTLTLELPQEGLLTTKKSFVVPESWHCDRVDFILGDAQALPFPTGLFSKVASLNLLDKIPRPLRHIEELNRTARRSGAQLLVSDPFSWSTEVSEADHWLGGKREGAFSGRGMDNLTACLRGEEERLKPPWTVEGQGRLWWKIRNHENHFELIRSQWVKAKR